MGLGGREERGASSKEIVGQWRLLCQSLEGVWIRFAISTISQSFGAGPFHEMTYTHAGHQLVNTLSPVWLPIIENSFQIQALGCLSILVCKVINLHLFCLYMVLVVGVWEKLCTRLSRQRPFLNQKLCSPNCQVYLLLVFIQPKNLDVNVIQE